MLRCIGRRKRFAAHSTAARKQGPHLTQFSKQLNSDELPASCNHCKVHRNKPVNQPNRNLNLMHHCKQACCIRFFYGSSDPHNV